MKRRFVSTYPPNPNADFSVLYQYILSGTTADFDDESTGNATSWTWTFEGGVPSAKTHTQINPTINITYYSAGTFTVTQTATNFAGSDTEIKEDFIHVVSYPPVWNVPENTGTVAVIIVLISGYTVGSCVGLSPKIDGVPISPGDWIGVFYLDDSLQRVCGGSDIWQGNKNIVFSAYGDNSPGGEPKNGFSYAEEFYFKIYSFSTEQEYDVDLVQYCSTGSDFTTTNKWYPLGLSGVRNMEVNT